VQLPIAILVSPPPAQVQGEVGVAVWEDTVGAYDDFSADSGPVMQGGGHIDATPVAQSFDREATASSYQDFSEGGEEVGVVGAATPVTRLDSSASHGGEREIPGIARLDSYADFEDGDTGG